MDIITIYLGMGIRGTIAEDDYSVGDAKISVSYPAQINPPTNFGFSKTIDLPKSLSTVFKVSWRDKDGKTAARLAANHLAGSLQSTMP